MLAVILACTLKKIIMSQFWNHPKIFWRGGLRKHRLRFRRRRLQLLPSRCERNWTLQPGDKIDRPQLIHIDPQSRLQLSQQQSGRDTCEYSKAS